MNVSPVVYSAIAPLYCEHATFRHVAFLQGEVVLRAYATRFLFTLRPAWLPACAMRFLARVCTARLRHQVRVIFRSPSLQRRRTTLDVKHFAQDQNPVPLRTVTQSYVETVAGTIMESIHNRGSTRPSLHPIPHVRVAVVSLRRK